MNGQAEVDAVVASGPLGEELYELYRTDPQRVDGSWQRAFVKCEQENGGRQSLSAIPSQALSSSDDQRRAIADLLNAYRHYGHLMAHINPLATTEPSLPPELQLEALGFAYSQLDQLFPTLGLLPADVAPLSSIVQALQRIYCQSVGVEYMSIANRELKSWLQQQIEPKGFALSGDIAIKRLTLEHLNKSELFESFLQVKYPGQKRFSLEGGETLIPILAAVINKGAELDVYEFIIGMAHRGRLNVLSNILNKSNRQIFYEFDDAYISESFEQSGDVKYHKGFFSETLSSYGHKISIVLTPNPSHLEAVAPVVEGQAYAKQHLRGSSAAVMPIVIHGDAALAGQGVVYETLQMYKLKGYCTGGTVHLVVNNQIGFTTVPKDSRSTTYCTDIAHAFDAPVFHVNAEDPEGCVMAALLAAQIRQRFRCDVFIDMVCYRKYGHNEGDEPAYTQPLIYKEISNHRLIREIYRDTLIQQGIVERQLAEELETQFKQQLQLELLEAKELVRHPQPPHVAAAIQQESEAIDTHVPLQRLQEIAAAVTAIPGNFNLHPKLHRLLSDRAAMVSGDGTAQLIDWGMAEALAFGSLLWDGCNVRLSGQDVCRGTFSHRHAMLVDQQQETPYYPLKNLHPNQGHFALHNSLLSEYAVLGFEYGHSIADPGTLVIWEAQFGDFCNGAQIIIDQFIATGEQKWGQQIGLVLLLPHGYEGQGPEHSSGRMERFLTLAGQNNIQIANPSTPAQFFHLLRRQALNPVKKPLVVFTPKALLRHPACMSSGSDLAIGTFQELIDDLHGEENAEKVVFCCGHLYYDLLAERKKRRATGVAIVRIEQLYPLDRVQLCNLFHKYRQVRSVVWAQEEPRNMGAGEYVRSAFQELLLPGMAFAVIARPRSASPAVGSYALHKQQLADLLKEIFESAASTPVQ